MANEVSNTLLTPLIRVSISKQDISKYLDMIRMIRQMALSTDDQETLKMCDGELLGYKNAKDVPEWRKFKRNGLVLRKSLNEISYLFERFKYNDDEIVFIDGKPIRLRQLKYMMYEMETHLWNFIGTTIASMSQGGGFEAPKIDLSGLANLPPEIQDIMKDLMSEDVPPKEDDKE
jgi:hypothetical protein